MSEIRVFQSLFGALELSAKEANIFTIALCQPNKKTMNNMLFSTFTIRCFKLHSVWKVQCSGKCPKIRCSASKCWQWWTRNFGGAYFHQQGVVTSTFSFDSFCTRTFQFDKSWVQKCSKSSIWLISQVITPWSHNQSPINGSILGMSRNKWSCHR